ncbi:MAG: hypothetical protein H3Z50_03525 [archaeon]|nr:hypothetical protein [archaeon]MCP8306638.1 hypothetical protein [archaeon]
MKIKVKISIDFKGGKVAEAVYGSLKPDNIDLPKGLDIEMKVEGDRLIIDFSSTGRLETLISTIDDLLACCQASTNTLRELESFR